MSEIIVVGLSSWIIQDGNYADFTEGQTRPFALEYYPIEPLLRTESSHDAVPTYTYQGRGEYSVFGRSVWSETEELHAERKDILVESSILNFGLLAYRARSFPPIGVGGYFSGRVVLGIDHYSYFEFLSKIPGVPALITDWRIQRIEIQTSPFVEVEKNHFQRDPEKLGWREIKRTNAWKDDGGYAEYLLHCERIGTSYRHALKA